MIPTQVDTLVRLSGLVELPFSLAAPAQRTPHVYVVNQRVIAIELDATTIGTAVVTLRWSGFTIPRDLAPMEPSETLQDFIPAVTLDATTPARPSVYIGSAPLVVFELTTPDGAASSDAKVRINPP